MTRAHRSRLTINELAVTLGNIVGGALFVGAAFYCVHGSRRWRLSGSRASAGEADVRSK